jgi:lipid-binding SYLF domain-containing protein
MAAGEKFMRNKLYITALIYLLVSFFVVGAKDSDSQTEGFNVKTPTQKIADSAESFVKQLAGDLKDNHKDAIPKELLCSAKCIVVLPSIDQDNVRKDFDGTGLLSCLKINSDNLTPPIFYEINELTSFYENGGNIIVFVTDETGVKSLLVNSLELTSDNSEPGKTGADTEFKSSKSLVIYAKPKEENLEGYDLSGSNLVYANRDTFKAYQKTMVPVDILRYDQDIPPGMRGFNSAVKELRAVCK